MIKFRHVYGHSQGQDFSGADHSLPHPSFSFFIKQKLPLTLEAIRQMPTVLTWLDPFQKNCILVRNNLQSCDPSQQLHSVFCRLLLSKKTVGLTSLVRKSDNLHIVHRVLLLAACAEKHQANNFCFWGDQTLTDSLSRPSRVEKPVCKLEGFSNRGGLTEDTSQRTEVKSDTPMS